MTEGPSPYAPGRGTAGAPLGTIEALGLGWRLMRSDFWPLWTVAIVFVLVLSGAGCVPFGQFIAAPPLFAGFLYVLARRIDGHAARAGDLFEGFKQRFAESLLAMLPVLILWLVLYGIEIVSYIILIIPTMMADSGRPPDIEEFYILYVPFMVIGLGVSILASLFQMFFAFAPLAVWQTPRAGWEAAKISVRLVRDHLGSMLGLLVLGWLILLGAELAGLAACCIGLLFTGPAVLVWIGGAVVFLYRSWTGQALVQPASPSPAAGEGPWPGAGAVPPTGR